MALITCPECNQQISDRAVACPHCGYPLPSSNANTDIVSSAEPTNVKPEEICTEPVAKPRKKRFVIIAVICAFVLTCIGGVTAFAIIKHQQEQDAIEQAKRQARSEYIENIKDFHYATLTGAADAERICNLTKSVWYDTIYEVYDVETAPYTRTNGEYHDDFNDSLAKLYSSTEVKTAVSDIKSNQETVDNLYKKLLNPEPEFKDCFEEAEALYNAYYDLTKLAISPTGSLKSYSENLAAYDDDFISHYDKLKLLIPED